MSTLVVQGMRGGYATADEIVKGIDLTVQDRDLAVIIGPNGLSRMSIIRLLLG